MRVVAGIGSSNLTRVHLEMDTGDGPASVRVEAPPGHLVATVEAPGQPTGRRKVGRSAGPSTGPAGLGAELQLFGRDRVFEDALAQAAGPARVSADRGSGGLKPGPPVDRLEVVEARTSWPRRPPGRPWPTWRRRWRPTAPPPGC